MQPYINYLLADLKAARNNKPVKPNYKVLYPDHPANDPMYKGTMDYMIEFEHGPEWNMDDLFEVKGEAFPPVEKLNDEQALQLVNGILELWASFNICADILNDKIPVKMVYEVLVKYWKTETVQYISEGTLHLEFCSYDVDNCPWGYEYCTCKDSLEYNMNLEEEEEDDDSPDFTGLDIEDSDELPL